MPTTRKPIDQHKINASYDQILKSDSASLKVLKVTKWALMRGGTFTAAELRRRFPNVSKPHSYRIVKEWRSVFGLTAPLHFRRGKEDRLAISTAKDKRTAALDIPPTQVPIYKESAPAADSTPRAAVSLASLLGD